MFSLFLCQILHWEQLNLLSYNSYVYKNSGIIAVNY